MLADKLRNHMLRASPMKLSDSEGVEVTDYGDLRRCETWPPWTTNPF